MPSFNITPFVKKYTITKLSLTEINSLYAKLFPNRSKNCEIIINYGFVHLYPQNQIEADRRESRPSFEADIVSSNSSVYTPRLENERVLPCSIREINPDIELISVG